MILPKEYYSVIRRNELSAGRRPGGTLNVCYISERSQSEKLWDSNYMTFGNNENYGDSLKKISLPESWGRQRRTDETRRDLRAVEPYDT